MACKEQPGPLTSSVEPFHSTPSMATLSDVNEFSLILPSKIAKDQITESEFKYQPLSFGGIPMRVDSIPVESYGSTLKLSPVKKKEFSEFLFTEDARRTNTERENNRPNFCLPTEDNYLSECS